MKSIYIATIVLVGLTAFVKAECPCGSSDIECLMNCVNTADDCLGSCADGDCINSCVENNWPGVPKSNKEIANAASATGASVFAKVPGSTTEAASAASTTDSMAAMSTPLGATTTMDAMTTALMTNSMITTETISGTATTTGTITPSLPAFPTATFMSSYTTYSFSTLTFPAFSTSTLAHTSSTSAVPLPSATIGGAARPMVPLAAVLVSMLVVAVLNTV